MYQKVFWKFNQQIYIRMDACNEASAAPSLKGLRYYFNYLSISSRTCTRNKLLDSLLWFWKITRIFKWLMCMFEGAMKHLQRQQVRICMLTTDEVFIFKWKNNVTKPCKSIITIEDLSPDSLVQCYYLIKHFQRIGERTFSWMTHRKLSSKTEII